MKLTGVAALADRPVDGRRVAIVMGVVGVVLAVALGGMAELLLAGASDEPAAARTLRRLGQVGAAPAGEPAHVAVVLIDGMRVDEARAMESWRALAPASVTGTVRLRLPTLSRPFDHHAFTGVPPDLSGVRTNRFADPARHDSVMDRVREEGGSVFIAADGLDWIRRMHGAVGDGGSDDPDTLGAPLDDILEGWRSAPAPALLVVHYVETDATAHDGGIESAAHIEALETADALIARVAAVEDATLFVVSDHGHRANGGHGGDEPEVARVPLLVRSPSGPSRAIERPLDADVLAPTVALALGVPRPRSAIGEALAPLLARPAPLADGWTLRASSIADAARVDAQGALHARRRWLLPLALLLIVMTLGPIKRAWGFDRSVPVAMLVPLLVVGGHLALDRPLTLSAIDTRAVHIARVLSLGAGGAAVAIALARLVSTEGDPLSRLRRAAATAGWSAFAPTVAILAATGLALGPWHRSATWFYLPLLACGAGAAALATCALTLLATTLRGDE